MVYEFNEEGLEFQIEDHIYQLMERFNRSKDEIREMVKEILENFEEDLV